MTLRSLGALYGTDKVAHGFCDTYDNKFGSVKSTVLQVLEVGVFFGSSLRMWQDYFPQATIHGIDTFEGLQGNGSRFPNADKFYKEWTEGTYNTPRIKLYKCDQSREIDLVKFAVEMKSQGIRFDIIVEDGSHLMRDQQITLKHLFPLVKSGGYFVIEDIHTSLQEYADILPDKSNTTLTMINRYQSTGTLDSIYTDLSEVKSNIAGVDLVTVTPSSMTCFLRKK